jgi:hypothetical protein
MRRLLVISFLPFLPLLLTGCPGKDGEKPGASAEPAKSAAPAAADPAAQDKAGTDKKEDDKGGW